MTVQANPALSAAIQGGDVVAASQAAIAAARLDQQPPTDIDVEIYDKYWKPIGSCGNYIEVKPTFARLELPTAQMTLMGVDPYAEPVLSCDTTLVPVTMQIEYLRWAGWVEIAHDKINADGSETVECQLVGLLTMLDRILVWPEPFLPIEIQPSEAIYMGPAITVLKTMVAENCLRLQLGLWELVNTLGSLDVDWRAWFGTLLVDGLSPAAIQQMVTTPICVIFTDPLEDTSPWIAMHGRMDTCWKLMLQHLRDNGLYPSMDLWLPGEPQPEGVLFPLTVPTYIFNIKDYQGVTGPSGTVADGAVRDLVSLAGSLLGTTRSSFLNPDNEYVPPGSNIEIAPVLGVNFVPPWVVFNADVKDSGITSLDIAHHAMQAWNLTLGGKSPQWLNDLLNASLEYLVDILMIAIGITGIPNSILDGIVDNAFLAFELFELFDQRVQMGPYGPPEKFFPTQSTYNVDTLFAAMTAAWDVRGYPAAMFSFYNGLPYTIGRDLFPGALASVIRRGTLYTDYADKITVTDNRTTRKVDVMVGDGRRDEAPMTIFQRKLVGLEEDINLVLLAPPNS
ncbi:hypothetical protein E2F47_01950 [Mycobacterium eburneum]|nr:hypothetical protein [Mycobacterium eburneum]TDH57555.1 hypothetical protein E2F47_01950 [Mycobacterium eburneum]